MKADIHPELRDVKIIMTDGSEFMTRSTMKADSLRLDIDPKSHPAWTGATGKVRETGRLAKFKDKYAGLGFLGAPTDKSDDKGESKSA